MFLQVIVGVHNDESYFKLKKKKPIDNTERRMENVKKYADQVCYDTSLSGRLSEILYSHSYIILHHSYLFSVWCLHGVFGGFIILLDFFFILS